MNNQKRKNAGAQDHRGPEYTLKIYPHGHMNAPRQDGQVSQYPRAIVFPVIPSEAVD
jgi:hypothetical protein